MTKISVRENFLQPSCEPIDFPGLISFWDFSESSDQFTATQGEKYTLYSQSGTLSVCEEAGIPLNGRALVLQEGQWLRIPRHECPGLDIHGPDGQVTLIAWIRRQQRTKTPLENCEFIAGQWNESEYSRQYGLFLNIPVWGSKDTLFGHLSHVGGPTPGYRNCIDGAVGVTKIEFDHWVVVAMSYDGKSGYGWLNGMLDAQPQLNPYSVAGGLHDGGEQGSDFTVGASSNGGAIGSFFRGHMAGLAVYSRALTPAEIYALSQK